MTDFSTLLQQGNAWLFIPSAIVLGALHGLEPGHSKTMMAAFIVAIQGTITQAILLGLAATISHTAVVWAVAMAGLYFGRNWNAESTEPYFQIVSAILIIGVALWMLWRTWRIQRSAHEHSLQSGSNKHINTGHGLVKLEISQQNTPARFRLYQETGQAWEPDQVRLELEQPSGNRQFFTFAQRNGFLESEQAVAEPYTFIARLHLGHENHHHDYDVEFISGEGAHHHHTIKDYEELDVSAPGYQDPHELAHANDIRRRFANSQITTGQIIMFGLTGGLIPCPASITVLLLCLQLKKITLGAMLVLCFSIGLALTMVISGVLAALSVRHVSKRWTGFGDFVRKAPYLAGVLMILIGLYIGYHGIHALGFL